MKIESDKRERILDAALELFTELGFHGTSTAAIAKRAEVAVGTLFHYFVTKEALINALYLEIKIRMRSRLMSQWDQTRNIQERFKRLWHSSVEWSLEKPSEIRFFRLFGASPNISQETREQGMQHFSFLLDLIEQGRQQGALKDLPTDLLMDLIMSHLNAAQEHFLRNPEKFEETEYRNHVFQAAWDMIRNK